MNVKTVSEIELIHDSGLLDPEVFLWFAKKRDIPVGDLLEESILEDRRKWWLPMSALFDGGYYLSKNDDVTKSGMNPLLHYLQHGYLEGRNPSPMVDIRFILQQLSQQAPVEGDDLAAASRAILSKYAGLRDLLAQTGCDPCPFFSNRYYLEANEGLAMEEGRIPLEDYFRRRGRAPEQASFLECTSLASFNYYMTKYPDLLLAGVIPLRHLLLHGLGEGRKFNKVETVSADFLNNSAVLFADKRMETLAGLLECTDTHMHLPGPFWPTPYAQRSIPALAHVAKRERRAAFIGVVFYRNTDEEVRRLRASIEHEIQNADGYEIEFQYVANDGDVERYRRLLGEHVVALPNSENIGFGRAHNLLMDECFGRDRLYIGANPDGYFVPGCIKALVDFDDYFEGSALIEASAMPIDHPKWHDPLTFDTQWVSGACFALSRGVWEKVKGFDEKIHLYCEDVDLSWRVRLAGGKLKVCPVARYMHDVTPRFYKEEGESVVTSRRRSMLQGAYYLARKWGAKEKAESCLASLSRELQPSQLAALIEPDMTMDPALVGHIADFSHDRFAPSRFW
ncbi:hypothetical protein [Lysobacter sp. H23M47]|uniref:hypothetical protein n=1 Tax=Lysobacter sp. H23M47 TaxID=2781024 RepID=UPI0018817829|nr:hypothetical protein [Lysobacter sp. H23M47]QOW24164.1 hypothetical protein INQ43_10695 [Lysobacter sp. H23M47]